MSGFLLHPAEPFALQRLSTIHRDSVKGSSIIEKGALLKL
jgi:hypothetical protein